MSSTDSVTTVRLAIVLVASAVCAALLAGCGAMVQKLATAGTLTSDRLALTAVQRSGGNTILELRAGDEHAPVIARLDGVRLVTATGAGTPSASIAPFVACDTQDDGGLLLRCAPRGEHTITLRCGLTPDGALRVETATDVALRSRVFEITLDWRVAFDRDATAEIVTPYPHEGDSEVAGDLSFCAPITYLRSGASAFALIPDLELLAQERRIPQAVQLLQDGDGLVVRHGLIAHVPVEDPVAGIRYLRSAAPGIDFPDLDLPPIELRAESTRFAQTVSVDANAVAERSLATLHRRLWQQLRAPEFGRDSGPLGSTTIDARARQLVRGPLAASWMHLPPMSGTATGTYSTSGAPVADFGVLRQALRLSYTDAAVRHRDEALDITDDRTERSLQLALAAPRRGGMIPARFTLSGGDGESEMRLWTIGSDHPATLADHFHSVNAATTGAWMLALGDVVPSLRSKTLAASAELARFFVQNQLKDGSIPSFYEPEYLQPRRKVFGEITREAGMPAWFLTEFARRSGKSNDALRAAMRAVRAIASEDTVAAWPDFESLVVDSETETTRRNGARSNIALIAASRAALGIAEQSRNETAEFAAHGARFCDAFARSQYLWSPNWIATPLRDAIRTNSLLTASQVDARTAAAADALLSGYLAVGRRDLLQRGVAALRTALATSTAVGSSADALGTDAASLERRAAAVAVFERHRKSLGHAVVDLGGNVAQRAFAESVDALWFEDFALDDQGCRLRLLTHADWPTPARLMFRNLPTIGETLEVSVNGEPLGALRYEDLQRGLEVQPLRVPRFEFDPPASILQGAPWNPVARYDHHDALPAGTSASIVWSTAASPGEPAQIDLEPGPNDTLTPFVNGPEMGLEIGTQIDAHLLVSTPEGRSVRIPATGTRTILVGSKHCIDPGDDDERRLVDAGYSQVVRFGSGRENARALAPGASITYAIPIAASFAALDLDLLVSGAIRIISGPHTLYADETARPRPHQIELQLSDPRLWQDSGSLPLTIQSVNEEPAAVAQIRYLARGQTTPIDGPTTSVNGRAPDSRIRIAVIPLAFADAELTFGRRSIERVFFGGDYRRTPEPESRLTTGSVTDLIDLRSGGLSTLRGTTSAVVTTALTRAQAETTPTPAIVAALNATLRSKLSELRNTVDAAIVVYAGMPIAQLTQSAFFVEPETEAQQPVPLIFAAERSTDGSILPSGDALLATLSRRYELEALGTPDAGNFGLFSLAASGGGHVPPSLAGVNAVRAGWADVRRVIPAPGGGPIAVPLSALNRGKTVLRLPFDELPFRPSLDLETHSISTAEPWRRAAGALIYWTAVPGAEPLVFAGNASSCRPRQLRLSPQRPLWSTPFAPAQAGDLFRAADQLDDRSTPSLATLRGDLLWSIERLRSADVDGGITELRIQRHATDLLIREDARWLTGTDELPALNAVQRREDDKGVVLTPPSETGAKIVGRLSVPASDDLRRLTGHIASPDGASAQITVRLDGRLAVQARCDGAAGLRFEIDLKGSPRTMLCEVEITRDSDRAASFVFESLQLFRRTLGRRPIRFNLQSARSTRLADGVVYGSSRVVTLDANGRARLDAPLVRGKGPEALRLVMALEADARANVSINVATRGEGAAVLAKGVALQHDGGTTQRPPLTLLASLPEISAPASLLRFLEVELQGTPGTRVHVLGCSME